MQDPIKNGSKPPSAVCDEAGEDTLGSPDSAPSRRRALLRAMAGTPVIIGISPAGANAALGSATSVEKDAIASVGAKAYTLFPTLPPGSPPTATADTWSRQGVRFGKINIFKSQGNDKVDEEILNIYEIPGSPPRYFQASTNSATEIGILQSVQPAPPNNKPRAFEFIETRYVLIVYDPNDFSQAAGLWPEKQVSGPGGLQALHGSSWSSISQAGVTSYNWSGG